jgi:PHD/YefM family antitoxin component YafN of YafNO toxin-antitoxin module
MRYNRIVEEDYFVIRKFNKEFAAIILSSSDYEEIEKLESVKKIKENMRNLLMELPEYRLLNLTGTLQ